MSSMQHLAAWILRIGGLGIVAVPTYMIAHAHVAISRSVLPAGPIPEEHLRTLLLVMLVVFDILATIWVARNLYADDVLRVARAIASEEPSSRRG